MTLIVLLGNALPTAKRKHRLQHERRVLLLKTARENDRNVHVSAEIAALRGDMFYIERLYSEAWGVKPEGAIALADLNARPEFAE